MPAGSSTPHTSGWDQLGTGKIEAGTWQAARNGSGSRGHTGVRERERGRPNPQDGGEGDPVARLAREDADVISCPKSSGPRLRY